MPYARLVSVLVLGLAANRADGETRVDVTPRFAGVALGVSPTELSLDRSLSTLIGLGPLVPYTLELPLDSEACTVPERRRLNGRIESAVIRAASEQLNLPMGAGRFFAVNGHRYLFCLEPHYREPGTGRGPTGWHKGVTVYDAS